MKSICNEWLLRTCGVVRATLQRRLPSISDNNDHRKRSTFCSFSFPVTDGVTAVGLPLCISFLNVAGKWRPYFLSLFRMCAVEGTPPHPKRHSRCLYVAKGSFREVSTSVTVTKAAEALSLMNQSTTQYSFHRTEDRDWHDRLPKSKSRSALVTPLRCIFPYDMRWRHIEELQFSRQWSDRFLVNNVE